MKWFVLLIVLLAASGAGFGWYSHIIADDPATFRTANVERGDLAATITATATIEPEEVVDVGAQVAGMIKAFGRDPRSEGKSIDYGSPVEEGTVLARIDDAVYATQVHQATANLHRAEAELLQAKSKLNLAKRDADRATSLRAKKANSEFEYDTAMANYETAKPTVAAFEAAIEQAKASLEQAQINLAYTTIKSPVKGVIIDRRVNVGQTVVASLNAPSLFLIAKDLKRLQLWASVNEADIGQIHQGQPCEFTVDAYPGEKFRGAVAQIRLNASMTQNVVNYTVVIATDNSDGKLLPYLTANVQFELARKSDVLLAPNAALRWKPSPVDETSSESAAQADARAAKPPAPGAPGAKRGTVWIEQDGRPHPVDVELGITDGAKTEITGEVAEGQPLIVGEVRRADSSTSTNPFAPKMMGGRRTSPSP